MGRRLAVLGLAVLLVSSLIPKKSSAVESAAGGLEFSGHIDVVTGWQHDDNSTIDPFGSCSFGAGGLGCNSVDSAFSGVGGLGDFRGLGTPNRDTFNFYLDEIELDVQKSFGQNIRIRADLDFGRFLSGTPNQGGANFIVEQGYVTANLPFGNGIEFLVGRFNLPMGYESVDRIQNTAISFSNLYRYVRPHNSTGAKIYYAFTEVFDWNLYVVNNLADTFSFAAGTDSAIPSWGTRFGLTFGEEGRESTVGISYAGGPENFNQNAHLTHMIDLDFMVRVTDRFAIAGEAIYRQDNTGFVPASPPAVPGTSFVGLPNSKTWAADILFAFNLSETWDMWFRYGYLNDINNTGAYTGVEEQMHDFTLGGGYQITDSAEFKVEYRLDLRLYPTSTTTAFAAAVGADGSGTSLSNAVAGSFGYAF
jgi:hypothetical protein